MALFITISRPARVRDEGARRSGDEWRATHVNVAHVVLVQPDLKEPKQAALELSTGLKLIVRESVADVLRLIAEVEPDAPGVKVV